MITWLIVFFGTASIIFITILLLGDDELLKALIFSLTAGLCISLAVGFCVNNKHSIIKEHLNNTEFQNKLIESYKEKYGDILLEIRTL